MPVSLLVSFVALGLIVLICRWVFGSGRQVSAPPRTADEDLGLLKPVAEVRTREDAEMLQALLSDAGIRAGVSQSTDGVRVLVFGKDLELARQLVSAS